MSWKTRLIIAGASILALGAAWTGGRYSAPEKVVYQEHVKAETSETKREAVAATSQQAETVQVVARSEAQGRIRREERSIRRQDGTVETTKVETIEVGQSEVREQQLQRAVVSQVHLTLDQERSQLVESLKIKKEERARPQWLITPMVGLNLGSLRFDRGFSTGPVIYGGMVQRRVIGPIYGGPWILSNGAFGISVTGEL